MHERAVPSGACIAPLAAAQAAFCHRCPDDECSVFSQEACDALSQPPWLARRGLQLQKLSNTTGRDFQSQRISLRPNCPLGRLVLNIRAHVLSRQLSSGQQDLPGPQLHPALRQALPESLKVPMAFHREPPFYPLCLHVTQTVTK